MCTMLFVCSIASLTADANESSPQAAEAAQATVARAIEYLEIEGIGWKESRKCAACHHLPLAIWSLNEARRAGYKIDEPQLAEITRWTLTEPDAKVFPDPPAPDGERPKLALATVYAALALDALPVWDDDTRAAWQRIAGHLRASQNEDGSWIGPAGRLPILDPAPESTTLLIALACTPETAAGKQDETLAGELERASRWLSSAATGDNPPATALRLMVAARTRAEPTLMQNLIERLTRGQRDDGGWSQLPEMTSDAYATGQALYALRLAGVPAADAVVSRGVTFLVATQTVEGNWPMISRPHPAPPDPEGKPAGDLAPIQYTAAAWATLGLARSAPSVTTLR